MMSVTLPPATPIFGTGTFNSDVLSFLSWFQTAVPEFNTLALATGPGVFPSGISVTGLITGTAVTQTTTDVTAGRLQKVGDFGNGGLAPLIGNAGVTDNSIAPGFYSYNTSLGSSGGPTGVTFGILRHNRRAAGGGETQSLIVEGSNLPQTPAGTMFSRSRVAGAWTNWFSGSIVDGATNANGRYLRHADGTQICWCTTTTSAAGEVTQTFPAAFSTLTDLRTSMGVNASALLALSPRLTGRTVTTMDVSCFGITNNRVATAVDSITIGRWF